jgi:metal-responsive CopG/Arc/MetJ family transcriptional regulator
MRNGVLMQIVVPKTLVCELDKQTERTGNCRAALVRQAIVAFLLAAEREQISGGKP